jgi:fructose-1,6-bisphosphatase/inositol monophosphatase family enzyme
MHPAPDDFNDLEAILNNTLRDAAPWVEANCGRVENETKASVGVEATAINQAVTVVDRELQDRVLAPVLARFPTLVPLVEEHTPLAERHRGNCGPWAFILDPIDGTLSYARGRHDYSTLAALSVGGRLVFGCVANYHPFEVRFARVAEGLTPRTGDVSGRLRVACHYRLFRNPFGAVERRLREGGCELATIPAESGDEGLGSNGPAILSLCDGRFDAYLAPHVALHDFAGPWCVAAAAGCATVKFRTSDPTAPEDWTVDPAGRFDVPDAASYPRRFRVLIARTQSVADRLLGLLTRPCQ